MSAGAALTAIQNGIEDVAALKGGWADWLRAGYPVEGEQVVVPKESEEEIAWLGDPEAPVTMLEFSDYQ